MRSDVGSAGLVLAVGGVMASLSGAAAIGSSAVDSVERIGWLAGCLEMRSGDRIVEEDRLAPRGGTMLGMGRTTRRGSLLDYELTLIRERDARLVYEAHPSGKAPAVFTVVVANADSVVFESARLNFPRRVGYRRAGRDSVHAWIDGIVKGRPQRIDFPYRRVSCDEAMRAR